MMIMVIIKIMVIIIIVIIIINIIIIMEKIARKSGFCWIAELTFTI